MLEAESSGYSRDDGHVVACALRRHHPRPGPSTRPRARFNPVDDESAETFDLIDEVGTRARRKRTCAWVDAELLEVRDPTRRLSPAGRVDRRADRERLLLRAARSPGVGDRRLHASFGGLRQPTVAAVCAARDRRRGRSADPDRGPPGCTGRGRWPGPGPPLVAERDRTSSIAVSVTGPGGERQAERPNSSSTCPRRPEEALPFDSASERGERFAAATVAVGGTYTWLRDRMFGDPRRATERRMVSYHVVLMASARVAGLQRGRHGNVGKSRRHTPARKLRLGAPAVCLPFLDENRALCLDR